MFDSNKCGTNISAKRVGISEFGGFDYSLCRGCNLKFNQDDMGMFRHKHLLRYKDMLFRLARTEGALRGCNLIIASGALPILLFYKAKLDAGSKEKREKEASDKIKELDAEAKKILFYNRFNAPTRPHRSLEDVMAFLAGSDTYDDLFDFLSYNPAMDNNTDAQKGLDSWMGKDDARMVQIYRENLKGGGH